VIRQVGGSFGVAILGTLLSQRTIFHMAMYGQAADPTSPAFQQTALHLQYFVQHSVGGSLALSSMRAKAMIAGHIGEQSFIQAINDDFLIAGAITILGALPIFFLKTHKKPSGEHVVAME